MLKEKLISAENEKIYDYFSSKKLLALEGKPIWTYNFEKYFRNSPEVYLLTTFRNNRSKYVHNWYPYLQGFSADLVVHLLDKFKVTTSDIVLDPWSGVGTTNVVCNQFGIKSHGIDISPLAVFIAKTKCEILPIEADVNNFIKRLLRRKVRDKHSSSIEFVNKVLSKKILNDALIIKKDIEDIQNDRLRNFLLLGLISSLNEVSIVQKDGAHYRFRNTPLRTNVFEVFVENVRRMLKPEPKKDENLYRTKQTVNLATITLGDSRKLPIKNESINFIITSPPYLNRDNYIAQNKLELFFGNFVTSHQEYRDLTFNSLRSHVEAKALNFEHSLEYSFILPYIRELNKRKDQLNNTKIIDMINGYFVDMDYSLKEIARVLEKGGRAAIVVANSSWVGIHIEVDKLLSEIAALHNLELVEILVTRYKLNSAQQIVKYGKIKIRESIIILKKTK